MKHPLVIPTSLYVGGVLLGNYLSPPLAWLFTSSFLILILALARPAARAHWLPVLLLFVGWTNQALNTAVLSPHDLRLQFTEPAIVTLRGRLAETPYQRVYEFEETETWRTLAQVEVSAVRAHKGEWTPAFGLVAVTTPGILPGLYFGGRVVEISGVLSSPPPPRMPGQFDYPTHLRHQGIYFQLRAESTNDWQLAPGEPVSARPPLADRFATWAQPTLARGLPVEDEPLQLLWTMTLGWKTGLRNEVAQPFMQTGTMHIFAISGLHIALITGMLVALLRVLQVPRGACGLVVIPLIWFYTAVTGWQASAIRSTIMMTVVVLGWALRRPGDLLNSVAASGLIILAWDPRQLFQASFQLSFFVVLCIALLLPPLEAVSARLLQTDPFLPAELVPWWRRQLNRGLRHVSLSLATSLAAWLGSLPLIAYYFNLLTPVSLLANLVIVPLCGFALMANLGGLVCGWLLPSVAVLFNHSAWFWMQAMIRSSEWAAAIPGAYDYVRAPSLAAFVIYYALLIAVFSGWLLKARRWVWATSAFGFLLVFLVVRWWVGHGEGRLTILPLPGGSACFIAGPGGRREALIDCGDERSAERLVKPFLHAQGIKRLPRLLLTHGDVRHTGGARLIAAEFRPERIATSLARFRSPSYRRMLGDLQARPERWERVRLGDRVAGLTVLHPAETNVFTQADDSALVLRGELAGVRVLLLSDLGRGGQAALLRRGEDLQAEIVVAGLPAQGEPLPESMLNRIQPQLIVVADTDYPAKARAHEDLRRRLRLRGAPVVCTSDAGAVTIRLRAGKWEAQAMNGERFTGRRS